VHQRDRRRHRSFQAATPTSRDHVPADKDAWLRQHPCCHVCQRVRAQRVDAVYIKTEVGWE
jgi:hypothetical protein